MSYVVIKDGVRTNRTIDGRCILAEILTDSEYESLCSGKLIAVTAYGGLMSLDSPLSEGQEITIRPLSEQGLHEFEIYTAEEVYGK